MNAPELPVGPANSPLNIMEAEGQMSVMSISMRRKQEVQEFKDSLGYLRPLSTPQQKQNNNNKTEIRMSKKYLCVHVYMFIFLAVLLTITKGKMIQMSISV